MQTDIDIEKIRQKLEKANRLCWNSSTKDLINQALSLLPPPCSECGGSRVIYNCEVGANCSKFLKNWTRGWTSEPRCETCPKPCPACQAPASEIEGLAKEAGKEICGLVMGCDILTAQAKRVEELEKKLEFEIARFKMIRTALIQKQAKVEQLEAEKKKLLRRRNYP